LTRKNLDPLYFRTDGVPNNIVQTNSTCYYRQMLKLVVQASRW